MVFDKTIQAITSLLLFHSPNNIPFRNRIFPRVSRIYSLGYKGTCKNIRERERTFYSPLFCAARV